MFSTLRISSLLALFFAGASIATAQIVTTQPFVIQELRSDWIPGEGMVVIPPPSVSILTLMQSRVNCGGPGNYDGAGLSATNNPAYKTLSSMLMAAFLSGKRVRLHFNAPYSCAVGRPALIGVDIINN
jgi:hypothetical protein